MVEFCGDECSTLYKAMLLYIDSVPEGTREDHKCKLMLMKLAPYETLNTIEAGYRVDYDS
tara:strand:+ start:1132 stop:1311 length:180 start_codon:yes stop_codon:yes gene_type:complete